MKKEVAAASVFGFWTEGIGSDAKQFPTACQDAWRAFDPRFSVFDDLAVLDALSPWSRQAQDIYMDIRIPACRSDIARLALLCTFGGTYIDAHTDPGEPCALRTYIETASRHDLLITQIDPQDSPVPYNRLFNSPLSAKAGAPVVIDLLKRALGNLYYQRDLEQKHRSNRREYTIFDLTGPNMLRDKIIDYSGPVPRIFREYQDSVEVITLNKLGGGPFRLYWHGGYRKGANHWTRREKSEPLFHSSASSGG